MGINKKYLDAAMDSDLFNNVNEKIVRKLLVPENIYKAKKNEVFINSSANDKFLAVILKGSGITTTCEKNDSVILSSEKVSDVLGVSLIYSDIDACIETTSQANTVFLKIKEDQLTELCLSDSQIYKNLMKIMTTKLHWLLKRIKGFTANSAEKKLALYIQDLMNEKSECVLDVSISKLATTLDLGRASLYRAIDTLENNNVILRNKKLIKVVDVKKLNKLCAD